MAEASTGAAVRVMKRTASLGASCPPHPRPQPGPARPSERSGVARPDRARFLGGLIAVTKSISEAPGLPNSSQLLLRSPLVGRWGFSERQGVHGALGKAPGAAGLEPSLAPMRKKRLGHDAPRRVAGAEKEDVVGFHGRAPLLTGAERSDRAFLIHRHPSAHDKNRMFQRPSKLSGFVKHPSRSGVRHWKRQADVTYLQ
jgi:hypothetical protein